MTEDPTTSTEKLPLHEKKAKIAAYIGEKLHDFTDNNSSRKMGEWYPLFNAFPSAEVVDRLSEAFAGIMSFTELEEPMFADFGSGVGIVGSIAGINGFKVDNIELIDTVSKKSIQVNTDFQKTGILEKGKSNFITGSYYTEDFFGKAKDSWLAEVAPNGLSSDILDELDREDIAEAVGIDPEDVKHSNFTEQIEKRLGELAVSSKALERNNFIDRDGKLIHDVVYCYPSDPFFKYGFIPQMQAIMKEGSHLVLIGNNSQVIESVKNGEIEGFSRMPDLENNQDRLEVMIFQKDKS